MKLRILDNSLRFRLSQSEVARLGAGDTLVATARFPDGNELSYALQSGDTRSTAQAVFSDGAVRVTFPGSELAQWAAGEQVGLSRDFELGGGGSLRVLVEKDFACLSPRAGEDESDLYPHPEAGRRRC